MIINTNLSKQMNTTRTECVCPRTPHYTYAHTHTHTHTHVQSHMSMQNMFFQTDDTETAYMYTPAQKRAGVKSLHTVGNPQTITCLDEAPM